MPTPNLALCAVLLCGSSLLAQTTYVVDINGGPGSHFTNISSALAVAVAGWLAIDNRKGSRTFN